MLPSMNVPDIHSKHLSALQIWQLALHGMHYGLWLVFEVPLYCPCGHYEMQVDP